ncbi:Predicted PurR-regulated permease PerM [Ekhidna lutea]|uniref:Predicted PurR-regulated permease PerM n=1 Tax=Ekhidna lutea TaxID=447679 RepID=A0A239J1L8_EKHLU|nr:AI-2E family transporter [Ekhidna lutea]SNS99811.1 Predicted PurR-regulated permease PerM [Ekhidna lutea]
MNISFSKFFYGVASIIGITAILYFGKVLLVPLCFAMLFAFILYPVVKWLTTRGVKKVVGIILALGSVFIVLIGILVLFSAQIIDMASQYSNFLDKLNSTLEKSVAFLNDKVQIIPDIESQTILEKLTSVFSDSSFLIISDTVNVTSSFLSFVVLSVIYSFLILFYSEHLTEAISRFSPRKNKKYFLNMLRQVQKVGQQYFTGMMLLILILGVLNTTGLLLLGLDYAFFFGFLAAVMAIIPYVGTTLGGLIPTLYAFVTYDSYWYPVGVIAIFWFIQFIEGNFLNPRIVGGNMQINALFSIFSLIAGSVIWGVAGMILFLPMVAMLKVVCSHYEELEPVAALIGERITEVQREPEKGPLKKIIEKFSN